MEPTTKISVVTAAFNAEGHIRSAIESIQKQTFSEWEMIIVDDSSEDKTKEIVLDIANSDSRVKYFKNEKNMGFAYSRDRAIKEANSDIIVINDSDDVSNSDRLEAIYNEFRKNPELDIFYSNVLYVFEDGGEKKRFFQPFNGELLENVNFIPDPASSFKRDAYIKLGGYDQSLKIGADYDLWLRALAQNMKFGWMNKTLVLYKKHESSLTGNQKSPDAIAKRQHWNRIIRIKNKLKIDIEKVRKLADTEVIHFYCDENFEIWFGENSLPKR